MEEERKAQPTSAREAARRRRAEQNQKHAQSAGINRHPCYDLHQASLKCLEENDYAQGACTHSFVAYKECLANQVRVHPPWSPCLVERLSLVPNPTQNEAKKTSEQKSLFG
jgi:hypothetical protein